MRHVNVSSDKMVLILLRIIINTAADIGI